MTEPVKLSGPMLPAASGTAKSLVVLLHGYGSDGRDLIALGQFWRDSFPDTIFVAPEKLEAEIAAKPPVLLIHGDIDDVVPVIGSEAALPKLLDLGIDARLHISAGSGHTIAQDGLETATEFLRQHL